MKHLEEIQCMRSWLSAYVNLVKIQGNQRDLLAHNVLITNRLHHRMTRCIRNVEGRRRHMRL